MSAVTKPLKPTMPYLHAIAWVALNDDPHEQDAKRVRGTVLAGFLADVYGREVDEVAHLVVKYRKQRRYVARGS